MANIETPDAPANQSPLLADGKLTLIVHDGDGTWHSVSALKLVAVTDQEIADLEDGDEHLLDELPFLSVLDLLQESAEVPEGSEWS